MFCDIHGVAGHTGAVMRRIVLPLLSAALLVSTAASETVIRSVAVDHHTLNVAAGETLLSPSTSPDAAWRLSSSWIGMGILCGPSRRRKPSTAIYLWAGMAATTAGKSWRMKRTHSRSTGAGQGA